MAQFLYSAELIKEYVNILDALEGMKGIDPRK
jgi:hypothetical protein